MYQAVFIMVFIVMEFFLINGQRSGDLPAFLLNFGFLLP